jgi:hypothetical protein
LLPETSIPVRNFLSTQTNDDPLGEVNAPVETVRYSFSGHETFPLRYAWLPKAVQGLQTYPDLFTRDDAMVILGVGKNMVMSIRFWCETLRLIGLTDRGKVAQTTPLGQELFRDGGWDPYLEDPGTLWLLHWLLVSRRDRASTWYLTYTQFHEPTFTRDSLTEWIMKRVQQTPLVRATPASIRRDVEVFIRTYTPSHVTRDLPLEDTFDCPLVELGLIREVERGAYEFVRGPKPGLPQAIFVYALLEFWGRTAPSQRTLSFESIMYGGGSPGASFKLSDNALAAYLEELPRWCPLSYDETAGRRLVLRPSHNPNDNSPQDLSPFSILTGYYKQMMDGGQAQERTV